MQTPAYEHFNDTLHTKCCGAVWVIVSVCVLCGMLHVSDFVKGMQYNICNLHMDICRKLATDLMNVVLCIVLLYSLLSIRPFNW